MFATILSICAALATILAVVGRTATNDEGLLSKPTSVGWLLILLALIVMTVTTWKHVKDDEVEKQRFSDISGKADRLQAQLSVARQQSLLLVGSEKRFPRTISIQIPVNLEFLPAYYTDPRDILFPNWKIETQKRYLGELKLYSSSKYFSVSLWFNVGFDDLNFGSHFENDDERLTSIGRLLLPEGERSCVLDNIISHMSPEVLVELKQDFDHFAMVGAIYKNSFTRDIAQVLNNIVNSEEFFDPDCYTKNNLAHPMFREDPAVLPYQDKRILNLLAVRQALKFPSQSRHGRLGCGRSATPLGGAQGVKSPWEEGVLPKFKVENVACSLYSIKDTEHGLFEMTVEFDGKQSISDWLPDFGVGKGIAELVYGTINEESVPTVHEMKDHWKDVFIDSPAIVRLQINDSGSVVLQYRATKSSISTVDDAAVGEDLRISWNVSSDFEIARVERGVRVTEKL